MTDLDALFATFALEESTRIDAPIERVWALITDVSRIGEFSPECVMAGWLDGATGPRPGARFAGTNRVGDHEWTRTCTVVDADEPTLFSYDVGDRFDGSPSGRWTFELETDGDATIVRQRYQHERSGKSGIRVLAEGDPGNAAEAVTQRKAMLADGMRSTLASMREVLERTYA